MRRKVDDDWIKQHKIWEEEGGNQKEGQKIKQEEGHGVKSRRKYEFL